MIYGVSLLAGCMFLGKVIGRLIGKLSGLNTDIGGVGFAMMLLLLFINSHFFQRHISRNVLDGVRFWKGMYMPIVIAMAATQDISHVLSSSLYAVIAGGLSVGIACLLLPLLNKIFIQCGLPEQKGKKVDKNGE